MDSNPTSSATDGFADVSRLVQSWVDRGFYPGAGLVVGRNDGIVLEEYFGGHDGSTVEFVASAGKWLAAAALAAVVDQGLLSWDDRVAQWLPQFIGEAGEATLRQLLSHTSGFAPQQPPGLHNDDYQTLEESVAHIAPLPLADRPGTRFRYGGLGMQIAGRMAELATHQRFEDLFQLLIARPLGLEHTRFTPVDDQAGHNPMLAGGARSSTRDYARFLAMIAAAGRFDGKQIISTSAIEEMERDQVHSARLERGEFVERVHGTPHTGVYGLGLWRERVAPDGRASRVSSPSWAGTYPWVDREHGVYGVLLAHVDLRGPPWIEGFNPFYSSAVIADIAAVANARERR
jgi:serine-type D-Ala-D-Ala carboxypeptidase